MNYNKLIYNLQDLRIFLIEILQFINNLLTKIKSMRIYL